MLLSPVTVAISLEEAKNEDSDVWLVCVLDSHSICNESIYHVQIHPIFFLLLLCSIGSFGTYVHLSDTRFSHNVANNVFALKSSFCGRN